MGRCSGEVLYIFVHPKINFIGQRKLSSLMWPAAHRFLWGNKRFSFGRFWNMLRDYISDSTEVKKTWMINGVSRYFPATR